MARRPPSVLSRRPARQHGVARDELPAPTADADRVSQAGTAPLKMRSQRPLRRAAGRSAALPLTSTPTCQRQLQLFYQPQVLASSTRMVLATTRRSMSASRSASRSTASVLIRPYTRIELVAARCTSARCCLLLLTAGLLMTSLMASLMDGLSDGWPFDGLLMASLMDGLSDGLSDALTLLIRGPRLSHLAVCQERERERARLKGARNRDNTRRWAVLDRSTTPCVAQP